MNTHGITLLRYAVVCTGLVTLAGCGCNDDSSATGTNGNAPGTMNGTNGSAMDASGSVNGSGTYSADTTGTQYADTFNIHITGSAQGTAAYNERYAASREARGYRARLMAELEAVRARLNDGTRPASDAEADRARAADLAQGLERIDRLIKAVETNTDVEWSTVRESTLKEAADVREWAAQHNIKRG